FSLNFLKLETGIRAIGMAGAQVAAGLGVEAVPYNPASIALIKRSDAYVSKTSLYSVGINHHIIGFGRKMTPSDYVSVHLMFLDSGEMEETTTEDSDGTGGFFRLYDFAFSITYARRMTDRLNLGVTMKYCRESYVNIAMGASSLALDIGSVFDTGLWGIILGMSVSNFGPELQYYGDALEISKDLVTDEPEQSVTKSWPLPLTFRMGIKTDIIGKDSYYIKDPIHQLVFALDGVDPVDNLLMGNIGLEYSWNQLAFVRTGYHINHDTAGLAFGSGLKLNLSGVNLNLDYAFVNYGDLNFTHQFGMNFKF
ncbi:MAG: PorV/PorQ family protein, partial [Polyangiaceae bacterium]